MIYEIINPSDPVTLKCDDWKTTCIATCFLGNGQYGLESEDGTQKMPPFIFGGCDDWFQEEFGCSFQDVSNSVSSDALASCLEGCLTGDIKSRCLFESAIARMDAENARKYRDEWNKKRGTSLNDISGRAYAIAQYIRERTASGVPNDI